MASRPPATTNPSENWLDGGTKATLLTKSEPLETKEQSYVGGEADSAFHNLTDLSRDADSTKEGCGNVTARTCHASQLN
jgi:hypothetical protein